jgi:hypothetical protein
MLFAAACSFALLSLVKRFENCHDSRLALECLTSDYLDVVNIGNVEAFSIVTAELSRTLTDLAVPAGGSGASASTMGDPPNAS